MPLSASPTPEPSSGRRLLANTGFRSVAEVGSKVATFALLTVLAREVGDDELGVYLFAVSLAMLASTAADFGQDKVLTREVARHPDQAEHYFGNTLALRLVVGLPAIVVLPLVVKLLGYGGKAPLVAAVVGFAVLAELLTTTCFAVYQSFERVGFVPVVLLTERWFIAVGGIVVVLLGHSILAVAVVFLVGALIGLVLAVRLLVTRVVRVRLRADRRAWWPLMRAALPLGIAGVFSTILFRVDMTMLAAYKDAAVVGNYGVAYRLFETTLFLSYSVVAGAFPVYAKLDPDGDEPLGEVFARTLKLATGLVVPLAVGLAVMAEPVVRLVFGTDFDDTPRALLLLTPAIAVFPVGYLSGYLLIARNRERRLVVVYAALAVENIASNLVLIPLLSLHGAAIATSITQVLLAGILLRMARRAAGGVDLAVAFVTPVAAAAAAGAVMWATRSSLAVAVGAGGMTYVAAFYLVDRQWFPDDTASLRGLLKRG
ncbi:MAG TPA: flippase [Acidimicrobiales bacterium]|nr:flippase [Acidimicrobiales bacterium]